MGAVSVEKEIRTAVDTGKVIMGERETLKAVKAKGVKMVIYASNCKEKLRNDLKKHTDITGVPAYKFDGSSIELGAVCGRPHLISMLGIVDSGDSDVLKLDKR
ncbi:MAG: 50S ribosomal protein L30e [Candidatus Hydrothermarchaeaceae archaeon]